MTETPVSASPASASRRPWWVRVLVLGIFVAGAVTLANSGAAELLSLEGLRANQDRLHTMVSEHFAIVATAYIAIYIAATTFSVPGAIWLTIAGGFVFGAVAGTAMVVGAATVGATLIFLLARYVLADVLRAKAGAFAARMEAGFRKNAFSYMLVLRLVPLFPFFLVNLAPAFLGVSLRVFFFGTLIGIVPGTFVFATVGAGLGDVLAVGGSVNPGAVLMQPAVIGGLLGLATLAMVPVVYRWMKKANG